MTRSAAGALLIFFVLKTLVTLEAILGGMFNALGWTILLIDVPFSVVYAVLLSRRAE